ncbi:NAD(P)-binding protein [Hortaea werneckii]|nr:NAD(P)-binding protein [Hortaea werneckii]KAI7370652.1 NAD(P)-binding protein [Hortaea werneckii]
MLAIVGASGKLGFATLSALLSNQLLSPSEIVCTTSSDSGTNKLQSLKQQGFQIRRADWDDDQSVWEKAFQGCDRLFLISSSRIDKDFGDAPPGKGREADHFKALEAARKVGVKHIYYTSLAFANPSKSRVMKAHERTEEWLAGSGLTYTVIREGLYNESWPLYFGHYDVPGDERSEVPVAGDSKISWTSIPDLGLANAVILTSPSGEWAGRTFYLSQREAHTLEEVAGMISKAKAKQVNVKVVSRDEHERYYVQDRKMPEPMIKWWSKTYDALRDDECEIKDPTLEDLLAKRGVNPQPMEVTVAEVLKA